MRKIKLAQAKKKNLPNLIRIERENILEERGMLAGEEIVESPEHKSGEMQRTNSFGTTKKMQLAAMLEE